VLRFPKAVSVASNQSLKADVKGRSAKLPTAQTRKQLLSLQV